MISLIKSIKRSCSRFIFLILAGLTMIYLFSCQDKFWDEHYSKPSFIQDGTIYDYISGQPDYFRFASLLRKSGYDSLLSKGGSYSVFVIKNNAFSGVDTSVIRIELKKLMGMHILPKILFSDRMEDVAELSISGKLVRLSLGTDGIRVNNIKITSQGKRFVNGIVYESEKVLNVLPNLYDIVVSDPAADFWKTMIDSSFTKKVDPDRNIKIGYDSLGNPLYKPPYIYKITSDYLTFSNLNNEKILSTVFLPNRNCLNNLYSKMLAAREGKPALFVPRIGTAHGDTTISGFFIPQNISYKGDSTVFIEYLLRNVITTGELNPTAGGSHSFQSIDGNPVTVLSSDIQTGSLKPASNGTIYPVNTLTLSEVAFRRPFRFQTSPTIPDPTNPSVSINNPNIVSRNGANTTVPEVVSNEAAYGKKFTRFKFNMVGGEMDFIIPFVLKGRYQINVIT